MNLEYWEKDRIIQSMYFLTAFIVVALSIMTYEGIVSTQVYSLIIGFIVGVVTANWTKAINRK